MVQRLLVIGGDAAGMSAASAPRRQQSQQQLEIVAFDRGNYTSSPTMRSRRDYAER